MTFLLNSYTFGVGGGGGGAPYPTLLDITNPGAEAGDLTGWTTLRGSPSAATGPTGQGTLPFDGSYFFYAGTVAQSTMYQAVAIDSIFNDDIDANEVELTLSHYASAFQSDRGCMAIAALDASGVSISCYVQSYSALNNEPSWTQRTFTFKLPPGTRSIELYTDVRRSSGTSNDYHIDVIEAELNNVEPTTFQLPILQCDATDGVGEWTVTSGQLIQLDDTRLPRVGQNNWYAGNNLFSAAYQDVAVPTAAEATIDASGATLNWEYWQYCIGADSSRIRVEFYESDQTTLTGSLTPAYTNHTSSDWTRVTQTGAIPANTRFVRFIQEYDRNAGTSNDGYLDALSGEIVI